MTKYTLTLARYPLTTPYSINKTFTESKIIDVAENVFTFEDDVSKL